MEPGDLRRHSITVSITAIELAKYKRLSEPDDVFNSALIHDIGKLTLGMFVKEHISTIKKIVSKGVPFEVAENMVLETDHAEIGTQILTQWSFPAKIINAVRFHHNPVILYNKNMRLSEKLQ
jgi:putative nucleotidyltransferase with HDIG domain